MGLLFRSLLEIYGIRVLHFQVQNALRSFAEVAENFPEDLKDGFKLSRALEPTDESGKALSVKEFAKVYFFCTIHIPVICACTFIN